MFEPGGRVSYVSPSVIPALGWKPKDCLGRLAEDFVHPADRPAFADLVSRAMASPHQSVEADLRATDQKNIVKQFRVILANRLDEPALKSLVGHSSLLTAHGSLAERYRVLLDSALDATIVIDADSRIALLNAQTTRLFRYQKSELVGRPISALFPDHDDRVRVALCPGPDGLPVRRSMESSSRLTCRRKGGDTFPAEISVSPGPGGSASLVLTIRDVSGRVEIEKALAESEARLAITLENVGDAVITTDVRGNVTRMNPAAERLTGWSDDGLGKPIDEVFSIMSEDRRDLLSTPVQLLLRAGVVIPAYVRLLGRPGIERIIAQNAAPILTTDRKAVGLVLAFRDVTAQKEMDQQIRVSDQMISLGTLAAGVAHEINNPLSALLGNLDLLAEEIDEPQKQKPRDQRQRKRTSPQPLSSFKAILEQANEAAERVRQIVQDVKLYSRSSEDVNAELDLELVLESSLRMARHEMRNRARLVKDLQPTPFVYANEGRLGQVLVNLLANAAQAIPEGSADKNEIRVSTGTEESGRVFVEIADSGVGIAPEILPRIFDPFFTTKPIGAGTGIGLAICKRMIAEINGTITVKSLLGKGSVFRVSLPAFHARPAPGQPESHPGELVLPTKKNRRGRVLVIEDEPLVRALVERALAPTQEVISTGQARDALDLLTAGQSFDVIFCEIVMPQMTGLDFYKALSKMDPGKTNRIVFVTGGAVTAKFARFIEGTRNIVIQKPLHIGRLRTLAAQFVAEGPTGPTPS